MTASYKILLTFLVLGAGATAFWLWYRQCYAVPPEAIPIMQQARAVLSTDPAALAPAAPVTAAASAQSATTALIQSVFPTDIPLPTPISVS